MGRKLCDLALQPPVQAGLRTGLQGIEKTPCCSAAARGFILAVYRRDGSGQVPLRDQWLSASNARAVISSTVPVPLMARYLGACVGSCCAQLL